MFSDIRRLVGSIKVVERGNSIEISGIPVSVMSSDIKRLWETNRINTYMFSRLGRSNIEFPSFFALDVLYMLQKMIHHRRTNISRSTIGIIADLLIESTWLSAVFDETKVHQDILDFKHLDKFTVNPLPKQQEFLELYNRVIPKYNLNGYLLAADPGTGKTLSGLMLGETLGSDKIIVACPKAAVYEVWVKTLDTRFKETPTYWVSAANKPFDSNCKYYIVHYEDIKHFSEMIKSIKMKNPLIILDESHNMNEVTSARTNLFTDLCSRINCNHVLWMSGTPIKAMGYEMIPMLRTIDQYFNKDVEERFKRIFGKSADRAKDILANRLGTMMFKVDKDDVRADKPIYYSKKVAIPDGAKYTLATIRKEMIAFITERTVYYKKEYPKYKAIYDKALAIHAGTLKSTSDKSNFDKYTDYITTIQRSSDLSLVKEEIMYCKNYESTNITPTLPQPMRNDFKNTCSVMKYVHLKIQGEALGRILGKKRAECHAAMIPHAELEVIINDADKKTLVFTSYVEVLKAAEDYLKKKGFKPITVFQETNNNLPAIVKVLENDSTVNPCIATYKSLSTAVPMIMCNTAIMVDSPYRDYIYNQAVSRLDRIGQDCQVYVYNLQLDTGDEPNISTRNIDILKWSREQVAAIMGVPADSVVEIALESLADSETVDYTDFSIAEFSNDRSGLPHSSQWI